MGLPALTEIESHPAFPAFVRWVETGGIVRSDLLSAGNHRPDWVIIWQTWLAGYEAGGRAKRGHRLLGWL